MQENQVIKTENKTANGFAKLILLGLILGIASITPGLSGGVLAIALGVYAPALDALVNIRSHFKKSVLFLMPLGIGAAAGVLLFGIIMKPMLDRYTTSIIFLFMGMVLGSLPSFLKEATQDRFRIVHIIPFFVTFAIGMLISFGLDKSGYTSSLTIPTLLASGAVLAFGIVIPGISSSFILLQMGVYNKIITALLSIDIISIFWIGIGFVITAVLTVKLIHAAFRKLGGYAHFAALGFLLSSIVAVFPGFREGIFCFIDTVLFAAGAVAIYWFMKMTDKK